MKIRNRITIWITGAGLLAAVLFSIVISFELIEQPFEMLDKDLEQQASIAISALSLGKHAPAFADSDVSSSPMKAYWVRIYDRNQKTVYASDIARSVDIPLRLHDKHYNFHAIINNKIQDKNSEINYRVRVSSATSGGKKYIIQIAKPMGKFWDEIVELVIAIGIGLVVFTLVLITLGYFVAGKILEPIATINRLAKEINDKTLEKRIPLNRSRDELHTLSTSLNQMFDRLQFSFKRQKEFVANASHELKTPIAMLRLFLGEAVQNNDLPEDFRKKLTIQSGIVFRMNQLVKNLLDLSTLELNNTLRLETINLSELAALIFEEFSEIIQTAGLHLSLDIESDIHQQADREKIRKVLINLIDNAIKYNLEENGEIHYSLSQDNEFTIMKLSNTGQIIPENQLDAVFEQFYRVEKSRSKALGGSGLGLTIVKQIVELHHGTVSISPIHSLADQEQVLVEIRLPQKTS